MLHACARPVDNNSVSACAPGTACPAPTLRCVVIFLRTGFSASYLLRLDMSNRRSYAFLHRAAGRQHSVSLCRYEHCVLFPSQLAPLLSPCTMDQRFSLRPICHASLRRYPCPLVEIVAARRPGGLPSAPSLLRKTAPFFCHRQRSQLCPCGSGSALYVVTPRDVPLPVDISSVSACAPGALRRSSTLRYGTYLPAALLGALP